MDIVEIVFLIIEDKDTSKQQKLKTLNEYLDNLNTQIQHLKERKEVVENGIKQLN